MPRLALQTHHVAPWDSHTRHCNHSSLSVLCAWKSTQSHSAHTSMKVAKTQAVLQRCAMPSSSFSPAQLDDGMQAAVLSVKEAAQIRDQAFPCEGCKLHYSSSSLWGAAEVM